MKNSKELATEGRALPCGLCLSSSRTLQASKKHISKVSSPPVASANKQRRLSWERPFRSPIVGSEALDMQGTLWSLLQKPHLQKAAQFLEECIQDLEVHPGPIGKSLTLRLQSSKFRQ